MELNEQFLQDFGREKLLDALMEVFEDLKDGLVGENGTKLLLFLRLALHKLVNEGHDQLQAVGAVFEDSPQDV